MRAAIKTERLHSAFRIWAQETAVRWRGQSSPMGGVVDTSRRPSTRHQSPLVSDNDMTNSGASESINRRNAERPVQRSDGTTELPVSKQRSTQTVSNGGGFAHDGTSTGAVCAPSSSWQEHDSDTQLSFVPTHGGREKIGVIGADMSDSLSLLSVSNNDSDDEHRVSLIAHRSSTYIGKLVQGSCKQPTTDAHSPSLLSNCMERELHMDSDTSQRSDWGRVIPSDNSGVSSMTAPDMSQPRRPLDESLSAHVENAVATTDMMTSPLENSVSRGAFDDEGGIDCNSESSPEIPLVSADKNSLPLSYLLHQMERRRETNGKKESFTGSTQRGQDDDIEGDERSRSTPEEIVVAARVDDPEGELEEPSRTPNVSPGGVRGSDTVVRGDCLAASTAVNDDNSHHAHASPSQDSGPSERFIVIAPPRVPPPPPPHGVGAIYSHAQGPYKFATGRDTIVESSSDSENNDDTYSDKYRRPCVKKFSNSRACREAERMYRRLWMRKLVACLHWWRQKASAKRLLSRVFSISVIRWEARYYRSLSSFALLRDVMDAWLEVVALRKERALLHDMFTRALVFRGVTLLANAFVGWCGAVRTRKALRELIRQENIATLAHCWIEWLEIVRNARRGWRRVCVIHERSLSNRMFMKWKCAMKHSAENVCRARVQLEALCVRRHWRKWVLARRSCIARIRWAAIQRRTIERRVRDLFVYWNTFVKQVSRTRRFVTTLENIITRKKAARSFRQWPGRQLSIDASELRRRLSRKKSMRAKNGLGIRLDKFTNSVTEVEQLVNCERGGREGAPASGAAPAASGSTKTQLPTGIRCASREGKHRYYVVTFPWVDCYSFCLFCRETITTKTG